MSEQQRQEYEELIQESLSKYEEAMKNLNTTAPKKLNDVNGYIAHYEGLVSDEESRAKLQRFKKQRNEIKTMGIRAQNKDAGEGLNAENQAVKKVIGDIGKQLGLGITMAEQIENDLQAQIEALDDIYDENMEAKARLKRIKQSLNTILRRIYTDKLTCGLLVLLVLGIIALIVVHYVHTKP